MSALEPRRTPYRHARRMVFGCTLLVALGIVAWGLSWRGIGPGWGRSSPTASTAATAPGPTGTGAKTPGRLTGVWEGKASQRGTGTSWTVSMALQPARTRQRAGIIAYPSLACGGELTVVAATTSQARLRERITYGGHCPDGGSIVVRAAAGGRLSWRRYLPGGKLDAQTTLARATRPASRAGVVPARLAGLWAGEGHQLSTGQRWTISMALQPGRSRRIAGIIAYPSLACGGDLTLLAASSSEVRVREDITYGGCVDKGAIVVRAAAGGRLDWKYHLPDGGAQDGKSTLQRLR